MVDTLNYFELSVLYKVSNDYPFLKSHIPFLQVKSREFTGVGLFINFSYLDGNAVYQEIPGNFTALSRYASLLVEGLEHEVAYEVAVASGKVAFLELVANGENWDGAIHGFRFK